MISKSQNPNSATPSTGTRPLFSNVLVIINPTSGTTRRRKKLKTILELLQADAGRLEVLYTASVRDATRLVKEKRSMGFSLIICAGGDGTINEVINGFMEEENSETGKETLPIKIGPGAKDDGAPLGGGNGNHGAPIPPLAILPTGTGNGLAREIGIPLNPLSAYQAIRTGTPRPVYPGKVKIFNRPEGGSRLDASESVAQKVGGSHMLGTESDQRYFILFVGAGFDSYVITRIDQRRGFFRRLPKLWIYFLFGFVSLFSYSYPTVHFVVDGVRHSGSTGLITKAKLILGRLTVAPSADIGRPSLVLCLFKSNGIIGYFKTLIGFLLYGDKVKEIEYIEGKEIRVLGTDEWVHADGESLGKAPALLSVSEKPLFLIYPRSSPSA